MWAVFRGDAFFPLFLVWSEDLDILIFFNREIDSRLIPSIACVASVSVRFRRKERGTTVKDREKSGASKRPGRGWGRKEGNEHFLPSPPPPPSFTFWFSFHFSRGQNRKSPSLVFLCPETKRKRLLHRLYPVLHSNFIVFFCLFCLLVAIWH